MTGLTALLAKAARRGVVLYLDADRGLIAWGDDRADPALCKALLVRGEEIQDLLLRSGWFDCDCEHCVARAGLH
jgi:hypothetical protein